MDQEFESRFSEGDAVMTRWEQVSEMRSTIGSLTVWGAGMDRDAMMTKMQHSLRLIPRLTQRMVRAPYCTATPVWVDDVDFDVDFHLHVMDAPGNGTIREVLDFVTPLHRKALDPHRPPWEAWIFTGCEGGRTMVFRRQHHAVTDGVGAMEQAKALIDFTPDAEPEPLTPLRNLEGRSMPDLWREGWADEATKLRQLGTMASARLRRAATDPAWAVERTKARAGALTGLLRSQSSKPLSPLMVGRSSEMYIDHLLIDLEPFKMGARAAGGTVNDGFLAAVMLGLGEYHRRHDVPVPPTLRAVVAINRRDESTKNKAGNVISGRFLELPADHTDPKTVIDEVSRIVRTARDDEESDRIQAAFMPFANRAPRLALYPMANALHGNDVVTSNVPGIPIQAYMAGAPLERMIPCGPRGGGSANLTLAGQGTGHLSLGMNIDPAAIPDTDVYVECMQLGFDSVVSLG